MAMFITKTKQKGFKNMKTFRGFRGSKQKTKLELS